jgi:hypothetical protein
MICLFLQPEVNKTILPSFCENVNNMSNKVIIVMMAIISARTTLNQQFEQNNEDVRSVNFNFFFYICASIFPCHVEEHQFKIIS